MVAAISAATIGVLTACSAGPTLESTDAPSGSRVALADVTTEDCFVIAPLVDGKVTVVDCSAADAIAVLGVAAVGDGAPAEDAASAILNGFAQAACQPLYDAYAVEVDEPLTGKNLVSVIDETAWAGVGTPVLCAVGEPE